MRHDPHLSTHLAISEGSEMTHVRPILSRFYVPSPDVSSDHPGLSAVLDRSDYDIHWAAAADAFVLGAPEPLPRAVPLGQRNVRGILSYRRAELESAPSLVEARTVRQSEL